MNFFEHQDTARRNTRRLVLLMLLAVISLIAITTLLVSVLLFYFQYGGNGMSQPADANVVQLAFHSLSWEILGYITLGVGSVVALGSTYKLLQLSGGGQKVAEALGGRLININTSDPDERKILNVVEEMAIASGTPVPPVYLIEEDGINAFAAGFKPQDAVIGITRGCIRLLNRDELQGVVAHEFSHILHGDMRLNIRLVGILHGILVIGLIGYFLLRSAQVSAYSSARRRGNNALPMILLGLGLIVIGYAGTFFGNIIKAAVSRQREFLADASAVQFTRNPVGISGALKKIGGYTRGSMLQAPSAVQFSHMFFGQGIRTSFNALMATHPPLEERIGRIEPSWDGQFPAVRESAAVSDRPSSAAGEQMAGFAAGSERAAPSAVTAQAPSAIDSIGQPSPEHMARARQLLGEIPDDLKDAAHEPFSARAVVYGLLLNRSSEGIAKKQWQHLRENAHPAVFRLVDDISRQIAGLEPGVYIPLLELCLPALQSLSAPQHEVFKRNLLALIRADEKVDLFEWSLYRIAMHNLEQGDTHEENRNLKSLSDECQLVLSLIAQSGHTDQGRAQAAYEESFSSLGIGSRFFLARETIKLPDLDRALDKLKLLKPLQKPLLLKALARCVSYDARITVTEQELFRAIANSLNCPVPPILEGQRLD
ncbi:M48 family metallopeptidase [Proteobacteria bacterium 005FR1]|nr:M48 family metallopeptidase [Proteobacteria bacterium 005FR1]